MNENTPVVEYDPIAVYDISDNYKSESIIDKLNRLQGKEREKYVDWLISNGILPAQDDGFFGELYDSTARAAVGGLRGLGATIKETTGISAVQDYFDSVQRNNQQWNQPENLSADSYFGNAIGSALGSTAATLTASVAGTLIGGPKVGFALGAATAFSQTFGENIQRNRAAGYDEDKAFGMAFLESGVDSIIENAPFGIVGKSGKLIVSASRVGKISRAGKRALLNKVGQKIAEKVGQTTTQNGLIQWGKQTFVSGLGESGEEGLQYLNTYVNQVLGGDPDAEFSLDEFADVMAQGFIGGFSIGGTMAAINRKGANRKSLSPETAQSGAETVPGSAQVAVPDKNTPDTVAVMSDNTAVNSLLDELVAGVGEEFGIKVDYIDNYQGEAEVSDGFYDPKTNTIYLDRQDAGADLGITFGHELKHYLDKKHPDLVSAFDKLWQSGQTEEGKAFFAGMKKKLDLSDDKSPKEFGAEVFGRILERPNTMKYYAEALEKQSPGMGEKFIRIFRDFVAAIKKRLAGMYSADPDMERLFNNVTAMEQEAGKVLAELRRRNGNSTQVENVVGAKGNTNVETVPVAAVNVDAQRFQFKSNTSKSSGVDESNKLGGDWDPRTAGNLYLWQDKNGKIYVVNGHHRLELAQRNNVENINAIIDREADGVTAEQARRNGVLINIRDGQGDIRDYAAFVRSEKLSEEEAKAQGVTARSKGRAGYTLGKSGDTLYEAYRNEMIPESKAVIIAEIAQGNEAIEYAGIKLATDRKLAGEALRQTLKLAAKNTSGRKVESKQGSLFDMFDDSVLQEWEAIGKIAAGHIKEIRTRIEAAKDAIKNPEAAKSLGVKTSKGAEKLLAQAETELARWENYATDPELMAQLRNEAGIAPQEDVSKTENTTVPEVKEEVVSAENVQTIVPEDNADGLFDTQEETVSKKESVEPVVKENLTTETVATPEESEVKDEESEVKQSAFDNLKDRSSEIGFTFDEFYEKYAPQLDAIIAKATKQFRTLGNEIVEDWRSAAYEAMAKAYMGYAPQSGVKISTYATKAVINAINQVNRAHKAETIARSGRVSLDQTNEQGEALSEVVGDKNQAKESDSISSRENPLEAKRRISESKLLSPVQKKIVDLFNQDLSPSEIRRKLGMRFGKEGHEYMSQEEFQHQIVAIRTVAEQEGVLYRRKREQSIQKRDATLTEVTKLNMRNEVSRVIETGIPEGKYVFKNLDDKQKTIAGAIKFLKEFSRKIVPLSDGRIAYFMPDERAFERGSATAWAEYGIHAVTSSGKQIPGKKYNERLFNQNKLDNLDRIIPIIQQENVFGKFDNKNPAKDGVIFIGTSHDGKRLEVITRLDEYGNPQADLTEVTVIEKNPQKNIPPLSPLTEVVEAVARHQEAGYSPSTKDTIPQSGEKSNENIEYRKKILRQQINPVVQDGKVRDEYADLLARKGYTPEKIADWQKMAFDWILERGGIIQAAKDILGNKAPADGHVAEIARRYILESDVFRNNISRADRTKLYELEIDSRSEWGRTGRAMQLDALNLKDVASVQALLNKLHKDFSDAEKVKLRNDIMDSTGIDIFNLPKNIVDDKPKLDSLLRAELAHKAKFKDKLYEYWINAILSGPATHSSNLFGNTANAVYELGIKRFTEALVNVAAGRQDGATFGEFKQMIRAFNWNNAAKAFVQARDIELLDLSGKFLEHNNTAIGGKLGRTIRYPGRLLKAADAFAKAIIEPMETAAYAYRMGVMKGHTGNDLQSFIQGQLTDKNSDAYVWGKERAKELTFQEDPGASIRYLMMLKESDSAMGVALRLFLPFIKTPANILRQGMRKSVLGSGSLLFETGKLALGKREFDGEYVSRVAEQLLAWGALAVFMGLDDEDDMPVITGSSADYGTSEYGFKANRIPPYSIRIGNNYYSYARIEPFATGLAVIADGIKAYRDAKNGKEATAIMSDLLRNAVKIVGEKSYIDSIGEIIKFYEDPERNALKPATNLLASAIPNIFRQTVQAFNENVADNKSRNMGREWWIDQFFVVTNKAGISMPIPKIDYFGREVKKDDWSDVMFSPAWRLLPVKRVNVDKNMSNAEWLIWNYNQHNPNAEYYPAIPRNTFTYRGTKMYFAGEDYKDFAVQAGQLAHKQINNAIRARRLNVDNPGERDIELIRKIFSRARKEIQMKMMHDNRAKKNN